MIILAAFTTVLLSISSLVHAQAPKLNLCQKNALPTGWAGQTIAVPLVQVSTSQALNPTAPVQCNGTVVIIDGCSVSDVFYIDLISTLIISWWSWISLVLDDHALFTFMVKSLSYGFLSFLFFFFFIFSLCKKQPLSYIWHNICIIFYEHLYYMIVS